MIRDLAFDEDKSQTDELHFEKQQLYKRHVVTRCRNGYELYEKLFCGSISHFLSLSACHYLWKFSDFIVMS